MAPTILPFVVPKQSAARPRATGLQATIIIFPGVRYEAYPDGERKPAVGKGAPVRRPSRKAN